MFNDIMAGLAFLIILVSIGYVVIGLVNRGRSSKPEHQAPRSWRDNKGIVVVALMLVGLAIAAISI